MKFIGIFIIGFGFLSFITSIVLYAINRSKYYKLLELFQREHTFPSPYSFYYLVGFFGAAPMTYFFLQLKKKKRVFFLKKNSDAYDFFDKGHNELVKWIPPFYYSFLSSIFCCILIVIIASILELKDKYFL